jgi:rhodanese-related sulfurtransferase
MAVESNRINPEETRRRMDGSHDTKLVCSYDSDEKFQQHHLEGAIPLSELESQEDELSKNTELIFYCA